MRFPLATVLLLVFAGFGSAASAGEMFQFLGNMTEEQLRSQCQMFIDDPSKLGFHSVGSAGQTNFDDRTFSFVISDVSAPITLYAFSDDGVTVTITDMATGTPRTALSRYGQGQALPNLAQSFQKCDGVLEAGKSYTVTIKYKNTLYTGEGDVDGVVMLGIGGTATANEDPYLTLTAPTRMKVGVAAIANLREIFPGGPGNKSEMDTQDTTISFEILPTENMTPAVGATVTLQVLDGSNNWVALPGNKFLKGTYPSGGQSARLQITPAAAGYLTLKVTATDSLGRTKSRQEDINTVGDQALIAVDDDYNFLPPADLVVTSTYGLRRNDYIRPNDMDVTLSLIKDGTHGNATILSDGAFTYKKLDDDTYWNQQQDGLSDTFTYKIQNTALGLTSQATVTIRSARASKCKDDPPAPGMPMPGIMLVGSGSIPDEGITWLRTHGNGGKLVILSGSGSAADDLFSSESNSNSWSCVTALVLNSPGVAGEPSVVQAINEAAAIFIQGGDQTIYYTNWAGTGVQTALQAKVGSIPISGGSAGMHLLGGVVYTPQLDGDGITSPEALSNPNSPLMRSFRPAFLNIPMLDGLVTDTHFRERDRMARSLALVVQSGAFGSSASRSIMADEATALMIDGTVGKVAGGGAVYFTAPGGPTIASPNPLTVPPSEVLRLRAGEGGFDVQGWATAPISYTVRVNQGIIIPADPYGPYYGNP
ncbi:MAG: cyanophycinase and related exopeptidase-like protein [Schlesneria sp.]|nr:cyanophycinase and related exopeptidase-like protein [Schlesneria sp.]